MARVEQTENPDMMAQRCSKSIIPKAYCMYFKIINHNLILFIALFTEK